MATYVYETIPKEAGEEPRRYEIVQSMKDAPLTHHPETGEPIKRVILGGYGVTRNELLKREDRYVRAHDHDD